MINSNAEVARQELLAQGWTLIQDEGRTSPIRAQVVKGLTGQYFSVYDPDLQAVVVVTFAKLREALGASVDA